MKSAQVDPWKITDSMEYNVGDDRGILTKWFESRVKS